jgi:hypothetical protein
MVGEAGRRLWHAVDQHQLLGRHQRCERARHYRPWIRYPAWVRALLGDHGYVHWHPPTYQAYLPDTVRAAQDAIQARLAGTNRQENSIGLRLLSDAYMTAGIRFRIGHPRWAAQQWLASYDLFWRPIRDYSHRLLAPLSVFALTSHSFDLRGLWRVASTELTAGNEHYAQGHELLRTRVRTRFHTIPVLGIVMLALNLITLHTLTVLLLAWALAGVVRRRRSRVLPEGFLLLIGIYAYAAFVMNIAEYGENMRFRLSVEPVIWLVSVWSLAIAAGGGRTGRPDDRTARLPRRARAADIARQPARPQQAAADAFANPAVGSRARALVASD